MNLVGMMPSSLFIAIIIIYVHFRAINNKDGAISTRFMFLVDLFTCLLLCGVHSKSKFEYATVVHTLQISVSKILSNLQL